MGSTAGGVQAFTYDGRLGGIGVGGGVGLGDGDGCGGDGGLGVGSVGMMPRMRLFGAVLHDVVTRVLFYLTQ
jgi:hypothetical protein